VPVFFGFFLFVLSTTLGQLICVISHQSMNLVCGMETEFQPNLCRPNDTEVVGLLISEQKHHAHQVVGAPDARRVRAPGASVGT
jgi:hypothetical protein